MNETPSPRWPWVVLAAALLTCVAFHFTDWDMQIARRYWQDGWYLADWWPFRAMYDYGEWPGLVISITGLLVAIGSTFSAALKPHRRVATYLAAVMILGPGLIVNAGLKDNFGRPRPREVVEFGGERDFLPIFVPGERGQGKSFPSGHASMGYYLIALYFPLRRRYGRRAEGAIALGIAAGLALGLARIAQGGHFASDVIFSGIAVSLSVLVCWWAVNRWIADPPVAPD